MPWENRITEWFRLERTFKINYSNIPSALARLPENHVPMCHIHMVLKSLRGRGLHHCPEQPVTGLNSPFCEDIFPKSRAKPPHMQLEVVSPPVTCYLVEEADPHLATISCHQASDLELWSPGKWATSQTSNGSQVISIRLCIIIWARRSETEGCLLLQLRSCCRHFREELKRSSWR